MKVLWGRGWEWQAFVVGVALSLAFLLGLIASMLANHDEYGSAVEALATIVGLGVAGLLAGIQLATSQRESALAASHAASLVVLERRHSQQTDAGVALVAAVSQLQDTARDHYLTFLRQYGIPAELTPRGNVARRIAWSDDYVERMERVEMALSKMMRRTTQWEVVGGPFEVRTLISQFRDDQHNYMFKMDEFFASDPFADLALEDGRGRSEMFLSFEMIDYLGMMNTSAIVREAVKTHLRSVEAEMDELREPAIKD
jgi:hypothetical protein